MCISLLIKNYVPTVSVVEFNFIRFCYVLGNVIVIVLTALRKPFPLKLRMVE